MIKFFEKNWKNTTIFVIALFTGIYVSNRIIDYYQISKNKVIENSNSKGQKDRINELEKAYHSGYNAGSLNVIRAMQYENVRVKYNSRRNSDSIDYRKILINKFNNNTK